MPPARLALTVTMVVASLSACQRQPEAAARSEPASAQAAAPLPTPSVPTPLLPPEGHAHGEHAAPAGSAPASTGKFGAPITAKETTSLAAIAKDPKAFKGKTIMTQGTVSAVCQERGCWMEITDADLDANVRMHGHSFFVPKTSSGKKARVQGTVMLMKDGKECAEMNATGASLELDATGIEIL